MAKPSEAWIESKVCEHARETGWRVRKVSFPGRRGAPDRWFFRPGGVLTIIEFKRPGGRISGLQEREIDWLRAYGFDVHVIDSVEDGIRVLDKAAGVG